MPLANADVSLTGYKFETFGGVISRSGLVSGIASFSYGRSLTPGDDVHLCEPRGVGSQIQCFTGPIGPPIKTERYTIAGEARILAPLKGALKGNSVGFAPRASYEIKSNAWNFELPIYLASDEKKNLNGGIRFAYDTGKKDFAFGLFVGVPFSIFYN
jgi:hypothetical protein